MAATSYEILVLQGDKWRIHAQFPPSARDDAIEEAKTLETLPGIQGIKVVRDTYDERTGLYREYTIHRHTAKPQAKPADGGIYAHYMARAGAKRLEDAKTDLEAPPHPSSHVGVVAKLLLVLVFSIAMSALLSGILSAVLPYRKIVGIALYGHTRATVMLIAATFFFLASVTATFKTFMASDELNIPGFNFAKKRRQREIERKHDAQARKRAAIVQRAQEKERERLRLLEEELAREKEEEDRAAEQDAEKSGDDEAAPAEEDAEEEPPSQLSPQAEKHKALLMGFFSAALSSLPAERKKMDNYNRFGVNLYLAGATEVLSSERNLDKDSAVTILSDALQLMGLKPEHADAFARRYEDYLLQDERYMKMFQSARRDFSKFLDDGETACANLDAALHEWNKPKTPENPEKEVIVMFTDIVGSTAMTQEKGNLAAQEVVRAHNRVVRDALAKTDGKEIKHTGDGIMASFTNVHQSLLAAQQMQMMIHIHNQQNPEIPLKVKIGINAGSVVVEEEDLYGATVQMAARIVDKAQKDMILVSDIIRSLDKDAERRFVKRGPYYMKGISGPIDLYEFVWDDNADVAALEVQAAAERPQLEKTYAAAAGIPLAEKTPETNPAPVSARKHQDAG